MKSVNITADDKDKLRAAYAQLKKLPLHIEDTRGVTIEHVRAVAKEIKRTHGKIGAIFIDYLTKMDIPEVKGGSRSRAVGEVTKKAKWLAQELDTPVIMLAQFNREGGKPDEEPRMEHLRDSGEIEQDADVIELLWNHPEYSTKEVKVVESIFAKGRDIGVNRFLYEFKAYIQRYVDFEPRTTPKGGYKK